VKIGGSGYVHKREDLSLGTDATRYRYYLVWIIKLPAGQQSVSVNEISLFR
jgi:hypothetical protein